MLHRALATPLRLGVCLGWTAFTALNAYAGQSEPQPVDKVPISWVYAGAYYSSVHCGPDKLGLSISNRGPRNLTHAAGRIFASADYANLGTPLAAFTVDETIFPGGTFETCIDFDTSKLGASDPLDLMWHTSVTEATASAEAGNIYNPIEKGFGAGAK